MKPSHTLRWTLSSALVMAGGVVGPCALAAPKAAAVAPGPFTDVPLGHPAYAAVSYLAGAGLFTGYGLCAFGGKRTVTRYEFAVATQRMYLDLERRLLASEPGRRSGDGVTQGSDEARSALDKLTASLGDPERRNGILTWLQPLVGEFASELKPLAANPDAMDEALSRWQAEGNPMPRPGEARHDFTEAPPTNPSYCAMAHFEGAGFFTGHVPGAFSGSRMRPITVFEFAWAVRRTFAELQMKATPPRIWPAPKPGVSCNPGGTPPPDKLARALSDPERRRSLLIWWEPLIRQFALQLTMHESRPDEMLRTLRSYRETWPPDAAATRAAEARWERPAKAAAAFLHDQGLLSDYPAGAFRQPRAIPRSEFAVAVRIMYLELTAALEPPAPDPAEAAADPRQARTALKKVLLDRQQGLAVLRWSEPLVREFRRELRWLGHDPTAMRRTLIRLLAAAEATPAGAASPGPFTDVHPSHPAYAAVTYLEEQKLFTGYPRDTFRGKRALTRYEFAIALMRIDADLQRRAHPYAASWPRLASPVLVSVPAFPKSPVRWPDEEAGRRIPIWCMALVREFTSELIGMGSSPDRLINTLRRMECPPPAAPPPAPAAQSRRQSDARARRTDFRLPHPA